jgi:hypothetical protein
MPKNWIEFSLDDMRRLAWLVGLAACSFFGCETPGKGPVAEEGYRQAAPVIAAIDKFREQHGRYPGKLQELVPHYLSHVRQVATFDSRRGNLQGFECYPERDQYELAFIYYSRSYENICMYHSNTKKWNFAY